MAHLLETTSNPSHDTLWEAQALWQMSADAIAASVKNNEASIFVDNLESNINEYVMLDVAQGRFPHLNLLTLDFVCHHGPGILSALRHGAPQQLSIGSLEGGTTEAPSPATLSPALGPDQTSNELPQSMPPILLGFRLAFYACAALVLFLNPFPV